MGSVLLGLAEVPCSGVSIYLGLGVILQSLAGQEAPAWVSHLEPCPHRCSSQRCW